MLLKPKLAGGQSSGALLAFFSASLVAFLAYAYLQTEIRVRLENLLFDLRMRLIPQITSISDIVVISVSEAGIKKTEGMTAKKFSANSMAKLVDRVSQANAKSIGVLLPHQDFDYNSDDMWTLVRKAGSLPNLYFGVFDQVNLAKTVTRLPLLLEYAGPSVYAADTLREYWRAVVRQCVLTSYLGDVERNHLATQMALDFADNAAKAGIQELILRSKAIQESVRQDATIQEDDQGLPPNFRINYRLPHTFLTLAAEEVLNSQVSIDLSGKLVLIGYTALRIRQGAFNEGTYVNSPWQSESNKISEDSGLPLVYLQASAIENLIHNNWFRPAATWLGLLQIVLVSMASFFAWRLSKTGAVALYFVTIGALVASNCAVMALSNVIIPLGDTAFASLIAATVGAAIHGQKEARFRALADARITTERDLSLIQAQFLDRFSRDLHDLNERVLQSLTAAVPDGADSMTVLQAYSRAVESSSELRDYLDGIIQLASIDQNRGNATNLQSVSLGEIIGRLKKQFTAKLAERRQNLQVEGTPDIVVYSDKWLLESILFNLLSNAIKYSPEGGGITVTVETERRGNARISVKDQGPGIDPELQERIFEKFYRIKDDNVYRIKGNGLGLYLSRFFARRLQTDIQVESKVGEGATFNISVPIRKGRLWW